MTNKTIEAIMTRSSIRGFTPEPLTDEEMKALLDAALAAPSGMNMQPWKFIAVTNRDLISDVEKDVLGYYEEIGETATVERIKSRNGKVTYDAPLLIFIAIDPSVSSLAKVDAGIAVQTLALAAKSIGLESVILGMPIVLFQGSKADHYRKTLGFPDGYEFGISIAIGHGAVTKPPHDLDPSKISYVK